MLNSILCTTELTLILNGVAIPLWTYFITCTVISIRKQTKKEKSTGQQQICGYVDMIYFYTYRIFIYKNCCWCFTHMVYVVILKKKKEWKFKEKKKKKKESHL